MAFEDIVIPQVGEAVDEVTLIEWLKDVGDTISEGDVLFEVDTDKAIVEIPAFADGILSEIICGDDSLVMPLEVVGKLETAKESHPQADAPIEHKPQQTEDSAASKDASPPSGRAGASPRARRLAKELSIDLSAISGSGHNGMITESDVRAADSTDRGSNRESQRIREAVAERTTIAKTTVPHFYLEMEVDFSRIESLRIADGTDVRPPTITASIISACASALSEVPAANVSYHEGSLEERSDVAVGVSVATDRGLMNITLPNLAGVDIADVSERLAAAAARARAFQLQPADLEPKALVVSNLGMYGVDAFIAIIDVPDPMILAVGRVIPRPVVVDGVVTVRPIARLTLSVDHRAIDGEGAANFLGHVRRILEEGSHA